MFKHILLPTDGSELSDKAVKQAITVAADLGARITAVNVTAKNHLPLMDEGFFMPRWPFLQVRVETAETDFAEKTLDSVRKSAADAHVTCDTVAVASNLPYEAIIEQAVKSHCDLIVMASHGRKGLPRLLFGSETSQVLTHSTIPVLVVR